MGHIKLAKANGEFDIVSADNVGQVSLLDVEGDIMIKIVYTNANVARIDGVSNYTDADVFKVVKALDVMEGGSGVAPLVELSSNVSGVLVLTS
jgi:hypothetical protein